MPLKTARLWPPIGAAAPIGLHLVLGGDAPLPAVSLSHEDERTRVLVAAVAGEEGSIFALCALKLLRDLPLEGDPAATNPALEGRMARERERLSRLSGSASSSFPRLYALDGADGLPPLFFCRSAGGFFTPPCPSCFEPLATCRDDVLLTSKGLPAFSSSLERFLHCPACARRGETVFYTLRPERTRRGAGEALTSTLDDLIDALARALARGARGEAAAPFPCPDCAEAAAALRDAPGGPGRAFRDRWVPFTFYGSPYLLTDLAPVTLDEFADLLGGRALEEMRPEGAGEAEGEIAVRHGWLGRELPQTGRFLFVSDSSGLDAVEVLQLKLVAFRQVLEALRHHLQVTGDPHLDIHPRNLLFDFTGGGEGLPAYWGFQGRLFGVSSAGTLEVPGVGRCVTPPLLPVVPYAAPEVLEFQLAGSRPADLSLTDIVEPRRGQTGRVFQGRLVDPYGIYPLPKENDLILVTFREGILPTTLPVRIQARTRPTPKEILFTSEPAELDAELVRRLQRALGVRLPGGSYRVRPDFASADLHSLGVVLLRLLLVNDARDVRTVSQAAQRLLESAFTPTELDDRKGFVNAAKETELADVFEKSNVFYQAIDRGRRRPNAIPDAVWERAVALGCRLLARMPGTTGLAALDAALSDIERLVADLRTLLFQRQPLNLEIQQVLSEVLLEEFPDRR